MTPKDAFVGKYVERVEDLRLLTGAARFVDDIHLDGMLHAVVVRSSVAHGLINSIDTDAAKQMPGVHAVYTAQDITEEYNGKLPKIPIRLAALPELAPFQQCVIAADKVRYVGEPVAVVIADTVAQAEDAAGFVYADIESLPPVPDCRTSALNEALLFESQGSNTAITYTAVKGDAKNSTGPYVRREKFAVQRHSAMAMETRGLVAQWDDSQKKMTVFGATKVPFFNRATLAAAMDLPLDRVDMIEVDVGGGFGVRGEFYPEDFLVPFASQKLRRPIKWVEDRLENLLGTNHSREMECEIELVCETDGRILAMRAEVSVDAGGYVRTSGPVPPRNVAQFLSGPYAIPNIHVESTVYLTNKGPIGSYRGPGRFEADFFRERMFDIAARELGIDPVEFRRINLVKAAQIPFPLAKLDKPDRFEELDSGDYQITLDRCLVEFGWKDKLALQGRLIDGKYHGIALGCFIEGGGAGVKETARIELEQDGQITVYVGSANLGQGMVTIMTQIAADALQVPMERIRVRHGSTTYLKEGFGSHHSRSTIMGGSAVLTVANALTEKIKEVAARRWECAASEVQIMPGMVASYRGETMTAAEFGKLKLQAEGEFPSRTNTYAYGTAAAHVTVDPGTGKVDLIDYFTVEDIGRIINPLTAKGQAVGAVVQGLGGVLLENLAYDENGQFLAGTLADYLMPTANDFPQIRAMELEDFPSPHNPLGAKGAGEGGIIPVGGVISNAVAAALSSLRVEPKTLPLTPPKVWALIQAANEHPAIQKR
jgi:carbon-monoxide dehydrogenase large subunit